MVVFFRLGRLFRFFTPFFSFFFFFRLQENFHKCQKKADVALSESGAEGSAVQAVSASCLATGIC